MKTFTKTQLLSRMNTVEKAATAFYSFDEEFSCGLRYGWKAEEKLERLSDRYHSKYDKLIADMHEAGLCSEEGFTEEDCENLPEWLSDTYLGAFSDGSWC